MALVCCNQQRTINEREKGFHGGKLSRRPGAHLLRSPATRPSAADCCIASAVAFRPDEVVSLLRFSLLRYRGKSVRFYRISPLFRPTLKPRRGGRKNGRGERKSPRCLLPLCVFFRFAAKPQSSPQAIRPRHIRRARKPVQPQRTQRAQRNDGHLPFSCDLCDLCSYTSRRAAAGEVVERRSFRRSHEELNLARKVRKACWRRPDPATRGRCRSG